MSHSLRWTEEQLAAHRKRLAGGATAQEQRVNPMSAPVSMTMTKYGSVKTRGYASKKEANRAAALKLLEQAGTISDLKEQVRWELIPRQLIGDRVVERAIVYVSDFVYRDADGGLVVEDCKGYRTDVYRIKKKLLLFRHGIKITET